jgi:hypothetical protein
LIRSKLLGAAFVVVSMLGVVRAVLAALRPPLWFNMDEGYATAMALKLVKDGGLPYVAAVDQRGPVMCWIYELTVALSPFDVGAVRIAGLVFAVLSLLAVFAATHAMKGPLAAGIAVFVFALHLAVFKSPFDSLALNGEIIALPFVLSAFAVLAWRQKPWALFVAGALVALGVFAKQTFGLHIGVAMLWVALMPGTRRERGVRVAWLGGGVAAVAIVVLAPYAATGTLHTFRYYFSTYGRLAYLGPVKSGDIFTLVSEYYVKRLYGFVLLGAGLLAWKEGPAARIAVLNAAIAIPETIMTGRALGHYFMPFEALVSIVMGIAIVSRAPLLSERARRVLAAATAVLLAILLVRWPKAPSIFASGEPAMPRSSIDPSREPLGAWVREHTKPDDRLFVWGFRADVYTSGRRWPASRFVYSIFQSGFAPWFPDPLDVEARRVADGSREQTIADLDRTRPEIIIDAGASLAYRYMTTYPIFREWLEPRYCLDAVVQEVPIYRIKRDAAPCAPIPDPPHPPVTSRAGVPAWLAYEEHIEL